jgi:hypothetical protein
MYISIRNLSYFSVEEMKHLFDMSRNDGNKLSLLLSDRKKEIVTQQNI